LRTKAIDPLLGSLGIVSELKQGELGFELRATARQEGPTLHADLALEKVALRDAGESLVSLEVLHIAGIEISKEQVQASDLELVKPFAKARRDAAGALHVAGLCIEPKSAPAAVAAEVKQTR
jgi:hypothetical protein